MRHCLFLLIFLVGFSCYGMKSLKDDALSQTTTERLSSVSHDEIVDEAGVAALEDVRLELLSEIQQAHVIAGGLVFRAIATRCVRCCNVWNSDDELAENLTGGLTDLGDIARCFEILKKAQEVCRKTVSREELRQVGNDMHYIAEVIKRFTIQKS